jgi:N-acetylmuramoyl-L-alanine amidase
VTLPVELDTAALLRANGFRVVVSRTTDGNVVRLTAPELSGGELSLQGAHDDVAARDVCANLSGAAVLLGIYFDSGASPSDGGSVTTYDGARPFSAANHGLATLVQRDVLAAMNGQGWQIPDDGVQPDSVEGSLVPTSSSSPIARAAASSWARPTPASSTHRPRCPGRWSSRCSSPIPSKAPWPPGPPLSR